MTKDRIMTSLPRFGATARMLLSLVLVCLVPPAALRAQQWPRTITQEKTTIKIYQPQVESFEGTKLAARAALSVQRAGDKDPIFGAAWFDCIVKTDREKRIVSPERITVRDLRFPDITPEQKQAVSGVIEGSMMKWDLTMSLDQLLASASVAEQQTKSAEGLRHDPPDILVREKPSMLLLYDGTPKTGDIPNSSIKRIVNSAFAVAFDPAVKLYYLQGGKYWFEAADPLGPWKNVANPSGAVASLAAEAAKKQGTSAAPDTGSGPVPDIVVSTKPAELIASDGPPSYTPISGTDLLYMDNTSGDVFMDVKTQKHFVIFSGRWFTASGLRGPWDFVASDKLPADFARIPADSPKSDVLSQVAGTDAARDAVMDAQVPQTATIDRKKATVDVKYDGEPKFEKIEGTSLRYATNTSSSVIQVESKFYCCDNAVWFWAPAPKGPWTVCDKVPEQISEIPASSPVYNVKYVYIYDSTPEVVYVGYTPGYTGCYVYGSTVVYGTGYMYPCWVGPVYYPRPVTYGFHMNYNPWIGWSVGFSVGYGGPAGWVSVGWGMPIGHPPYGYWGPCGYRPPYGHPPGYYPPHHGYPPGHYPPGQGNWDQGSRQRPADGSGSRPSSGVSAGTLPADRTGSNLYKDRANGVQNTGVRAQPQPANRPGGGAGASTQPATRPGGTGGAGVSTQPATRPGGTGGASPSQQPSRDNNVMTDRSGNVYRQNNTGGWEQHQNGNWNAPQQGGGAPTRDLNRDMQARDRGAAQTQQFNNMQSRPAGGGSRGGSGGARGGGGGGMRGGGGRGR
jgi:hypothetical protein